MRKGFNREFKLSLLSLYSFFTLFASFEGYPQEIEAFDESALPSKAQYPYR